MAPATAAQAEAAIAVAELTIQLGDAQLKHSNLKAASHCTSPS